MEKTQIKTAIVIENGREIERVSFDVERIKDLQRIYDRQKNRKFQKTEAYRKALARYRDSEKYMRGYYLRNFGRTPKYRAWEKKWKGENG